MSSFQELLEQKQKEADRQKQIREKQAKLEAERAEQEKAELIEREKKEEERARQLRAAARRKEQDDAEKARKAALLKEKIAKDRAQQKPSLLSKSSNTASSVPKNKNPPARAKSASSASSSTLGTKAPVLTREEKRKLKEDREFGIAAPNAAVKVKMSEGDRVARMLAAATAGRGLNAKIPERAHVRRLESERNDVNGSSGRSGPSASASATANRTGPTYKAQSSVAHHNSSKPVKGLDRLQEEARVLASSNVSKDRRSIDQVQRDIQATRTIDDDRDFFGRESRKASSSNSGARGAGKSASQRVPDRPIGSTSAAGSSTSRKRNSEPQHTEDTSYIINKMGLYSDERESQTRSRHDKYSSSNGKSSTPSKRRRQRSVSSDGSDVDNVVDQDFDSDELDDVDIRRQKKKSKSNGIGKTRRDLSPPPRARQNKRPIGGSVLAAAGLDIYKMFGRHDREVYLSRDRASDSEDDMEADAATIRKEEARAARQAREDDRREEEAERKRAAEKKRRMERDKGR